MFGTGASDVFAVTHHAHRERLRLRESCFFLRLFTS